MPRILRKKSSFLNPDELTIDLRNPMDSEKRPNVSAPSIRQVSTLYKYGLPGVQTSALIGGNFNGCESEFARYSETRIDALLISVPDESLMIAQRVSSCCADVSC